MIFVNGYGERYQISNAGVVIATGKGSNNNSKYRVLKAFKAGKDRNYLKVRLYKDAKHKDVSVHRLVALHFLPNPYNLPHVNHKDENTLNNSVSNLEWCTAQYNKEFSSAVRIQLRSPAGDLIDIFNISKFCRDNLLHNGCVYHLLSGKYQSHKGWSLP